MLEIIMIVVACVAMYRIADADEQASPVLWTVITLLICIASIAFLPLPMIRIGLALLVAFLLMMGYKVAADR